MAMGILFGVWKCIELERFLTMVYGYSSDCSLDFSIARSCEPVTFLRVVMPLSAGGTGKNENIFWCARYTVVVSVPGQRYYFLDIHVLSCRTVLLIQSHLHFVIGLPGLCVMPIVSACAMFRKSALHSLSV